MTPAAPLLPLVQTYCERDPSGAARSLELLSEADAATVLRILPPALAARMLRMLPVTFAGALLDALDNEALAQIVAALEGQHASMILMHVTPEGRERLLQNAPEKLKRDINEHLNYPEDSIARIMSTTFLAFPQNLRVDEAIERIRVRVQRGFPASYVYVTDEDAKLVGVMNMRDLLLAEGDTLLGTVMRKDLLSLHCFTERAAAARELGKRRFFAAPVVDSESRIVGIIRAEQLIQEAHREVAVDIQRMVGVGADEKAFSPLSFSMKKRLPWLHINLVTAFLAAGVVALFEDLIARVTVLAVFLPVVAGQGGNAGAQSLAIVMRGLVMREIPAARVRRIIMKEGLLGLLNGSITGVVTGLIAWAWYGNPTLGFVIGFGMIINLVCAGVAGAAIPIAMKKLRLDPAQCSSIILTTVTDVVGFFAFLSLGMWFESSLRA